MANNNWVHGTATAVAQVQTITITAASSSTTAVWTYTLTDDDGTTAAVTYTEDGSPTTTEIATGLYNALVASTDPKFLKLSFTNPSAGVFTVTARTAGVSFSGALADDDDGTHTTAATTASVGNEDASLDRNWSQNDAPDTGDDLIFEPGSVNVKYGLNQSSIAIADFRVMKGCSSQFGRFDDGVFHYFRIDPDAFDYRGSGQLAMFDIGSANISPYIEAYGSPSADGRHTVYIKGSNIATLTVAKGKVGVSVLDADTATVATILCGLLEQQSSDVDLTIGTGTTWTTTTQYGGKLLVKSAGTTLNIYKGGICTTEGSGAITTVNVYEGATFYPKSTGTITTLNLFGTADFTRHVGAKTVTTLNLKKGGTLIKHDAITIGTFNPPSASGGSFDTIKAA